MVIVVVHSPLHNTRKTRDMKTNMVLRQLMEGKMNCKVLNLKLASSSMRLEHTSGVHVFLSGNKSHKKTCSMFLGLNVTKESLTHRPLACFFSF